MSAARGGDTQPAAPFDSGGTSNVSTSHVSPNKSYSGAVKAAGEVSGGIPNMRSFRQIIEDEKKNRNIIEMTITKHTYTENCKIL